MPLPDSIRHKLKLPVVSAPMFLVSGPELVSAACRAGIIGAFPFPNAREISILDEWLEGLMSEQRSNDELAPLAVNLTTHKTYDRLQDEIALLKNHKPPIVITALGAPDPVLKTVQDYGGLVIADVNSVSLAKRAAVKGVDGLALICAGAGGHTGTMANYAFVQEVRQFFDGITILAGGINSGSAIFASQIAGADLCYMGTSFIAANESRANETYRRFLIQAGFEDLIESDALTGAKALYLKACLERMGVDLVPDPLKSNKKIDFTNTQQQIKAWRDIWSAGHGVGAVTKCEPIASIVGRLSTEYASAVKSSSSLAYTNPIDPKEANYA